MTKAQTMPPPTDQDRERWIALSKNSERRGMMADMEAERREFWRAVYLSAYEACAHAECVTEADDALAEYDKRFLGSVTLCRNDAK